MPIILMYKIQSLNTCNWDVTPCRTDHDSPGTSTEPNGIVWTNNILSHITANKYQVFKA